MRKIIMFFLTIPFSCLSFVETTINIDGDFSDWVAVLQDQDNIII